MSKCFIEINTLNIKFKKLLEDDYKLIYIEEKQIKQEDNSETSQNDLSLFKIEKNRESIFKQIVSADKLDEVKKEIKSEYDKFSDDFLDYFERVEDMLNEKHIKSFEIIEKTIKNRGKKLNGTINKFIVEDSWSVSKIEEEFYFKLQKNLKDIIDSLIPTISTGRKESSAYDGILTSLNRFLSQLGIYTMDLDTNKKYEDFDFLDPQECDDCETEDLNKQDMIKEILSYPYILSDELIVVEGKVILWKVVHNG
jgi:hypothetical protein